MQTEIEALLQALLDEQQRERELYQSILSALAIGASSRRRVIEDVLLATRAAVARDVALDAAMGAQDLLTEAVTQLSERRRNTFNSTLN